MIGNVRADKTQIQGFAGVTHDTKKEERRRKKRWESPKWQHWIREGHIRRKNDRWLGKKKAEEKEIQQNEMSTIRIVHWNANLTLTLPGPSAGVSGSLDSYCSLKPLCSGMGEVVPARTSPTLLPPSPLTVLWLPCFKVSQCINCRDWHCKS